MWAILPDLRHILYQRTEENGSSPFSDTLTLISSLQNTEKNVNFASPLKIQRLKSFQLQGSLDHDGASPQTTVTVDMPGVSAPTFQHLPNRPFWGRELGPHLTQCGLNWGLPPHQEASWILDPSSCLTTIHAHYLLSTSILSRTIRTWKMRKIM